MGLSWVWKLFFDSGLPLILAEFQTTDAPIPYESHRPMNSPAAWAHCEIALYFQQVCCHFALVHFSCQHHEIPNISVPEGEIF
jgi:hypothetical protein